MRKFIIKSFLLCLLAVSLCLVFYGRAHAQEVGKHAFIQGVGCITPEDVEKVVPVVIRSESMNTVAIEAAKEKIQCGPFAGPVTYIGVERTFEIGKDQWQILHFKTDDQTNVYSWKRVDGQDA